MAIDPEKRRAALIATVVTVPILLIVLLGLLASGGSAGTSAPPSSSGVANLPAVAVTAPPVTDAATIATCARVISALPLTLAGQSLRLTTSTPPSPSIVAWGNPAIVLRCGVDRPKGLVVGSSALDPSFSGDAGPYWDVQSSGGSQVYTTVDRAVYIEISVPAGYTNPSPMPTVSQAIAKILPAVCQLPPAGGTTIVPDSKLCTHRK